MARFEIDGRDETVLRTDEPRGCSRRKMDIFLHLIPFDSTPRGTPRSPPPPAPLDLSAFSRRLAERATLRATKRFIWPFNPRNSERRYPGSN